MSSLTAVDVSHQPAHTVLNPSDHRDVVGQVSFIDPNSVPDVITTALNAQTNWQTVSAAERAAILRRFADLMEDSAHMALLMMVAVREAGKTLVKCYC